MKKIAVLTSAISVGALALGMSLTATAADLDEIESRGYLSVATEDNYAPFNFMNGSDPDGFIKDVLI